MTFDPSQLESALRQVDSLPDGGSRDAAREIVRSVLEFHRIGLVRLMDLLREGSDGRAILDQVSRDDALRHLFLLHDLQLPEVDPALVPVHRLVARKQKDCERCELCGQAVANEHPHLLALDTRKLACACDACALLFDGDTAGRRYRRIRPNALPLPEVHVADEAWHALGVPVGLAFFTRRSPDDRIVAAYPGPAGAAETEVDRVAWDKLADTNPAVRNLAPDVDALLVDRLDRPHAYWRVSIDHGYRLVGLIRSQWRGISGGEEWRNAVRQFFASLAEGVRP